MRGDRGAALARRLGRAAALAALVLALPLGCRVRGGDVLTLPPAGAGTAGGGFDGGLAGLGGFGDASDVGGPGGGGGGAAGSLASAVFIAPEGSDGNPGTQAAPWRTFGHALPMLQPGATLVLLDGTYTSSTTGLLRIFCGDT